MSEDNNTKTMNSVPVNPVAANTAQINLDQVNIELKVSETLNLFGQQVTDDTMLVDADRVLDAIDSQTELGFTCQDMRNLLKYCSVDVDGNFSAPDTVLPTVEQNLFENNRFYIPNWEVRGVKNHLGEDGKEAGYDSSNTWTAEKRDHLNAPEIQGGSIADKMNHKVTGWIIDNHNFVNPENSEIEGVGEMDGDDYRIALQLRVKPTNDNRYLVSEINPNSNPSTEGQPDGINVSKLCDKYVSDVFFQQPNLTSVFSNKEGNRNAMAKQNEWGHQHAHHSTQDTNVLTDDQTDVTAFNTVGPFGTAFIGSLYQRKGYTLLNEKTSNKKNVWRSEYNPNLDSFFKQLVTSHPERFYKKVDVVDGTDTDHSAMVAGDGQSDQYDEGLYAKRTELPLKEGDEISFYFTLSIACKGDPKTNNDNQIKNLMALGTMPDSKAPTFDKPVRERFERKDASGNVIEYFYPLRKTTFLMTIRLTNTKADRADAAAAEVNARTVIAADICKGVGEKEKLKTEKEAERDELRNNDDNAGTIKDKQDAINAHKNGPLADASDEEGLRESNRDTVNSNFETADNNYNAAKTAGEGPLIMQTKAKNRSDRQAELNTAEIEYQEAKSAHLVEKNKAYVLKEELAELNKQYEAVIESLDKMKEDLLSLCAPGGVVSKALANLGADNDFNSFIGDPNNDVDGMSDKPLNLSDDDAINIKKDRKERSDALTQYINDSNFWREENYEGYINHSYQNEDFLQACSGGLDNPTESFTTAALLDLMMDQSGNSPQIDGSGD